MTSSYQPVVEDDMRVFRQNRAGIDWNVRQAFPWIPQNFALRPVTVRKQNVCGFIYDFKIAMPNGQFAKVSFLTGGLRAPLATGEKEPDPEYRVSSRLSSSAYA